MTAPDTNAFKSRLLALQSELEALDVLGKGSTATVTLDQSTVGRLSRMDALQGQQMALEAERRRRQQQQQIKAALRRLENGDYGYCFTCGNAIAAGRLHINPMALRCVHCSD